MKERIIKLLSSTNVDGIYALINWMEDNGFFTAPCSGAHHLCKEGGLAEHSLNVYDTLVKLNEAMDAKISEKSIVLCALLHDLGKAGDHGKPNYVENYVSSRKKDENGNVIMVRSEAKPYETNKELTYEEHEIRSVIIAERFIPLTEEEETAILHHNGLFGKLDSGFGNHNYDKTPLAFLLHTADMYCSRFIEVEQEEE